MSLSGGCALLAGGRGWPQANGKQSGMQDGMGTGKADPSAQSAAGDANRFLNAVVQALWHCAAFREGLLRLEQRALQVSDWVPFTCLDKPFTSAKL